MKVDGDEKNTTIISDIEEQVEGQKPLSTQGKTLLIRVQRSSMMIITIYQTGIMATTM
jgi:hypothetical protein